jgi:fructose-bisphosphate aldolase class II
MKTLSQCVSEAIDKKIAIGHFNISDSEGLRGVFLAAQSLNVPVIIGVSEGERDFLGVRQAAALVKSLRDEFQWPIFLNADHTYSFERAKEAIDAGFDSVIIDGASLPFEQNVSMTKLCVEYAKNSGREVLIEGELGYIGKSSKILDEIPHDVELGIENLTVTDDARKFVSETGVNMFAPAVGNIHGMLSSGVNPGLKIDRLAEISRAVSVPIVLHGASGNSDDDIRAAIAVGVAVVHVNTEIRVAYKRGLMSAMQENPEEIAPYKFMKGAVQAVQEIVEKKLKVFNNLN